MTAYDEHALRAFDTHAVDYVLKPLVEGRFRRPLDRVSRSYRRRVLGNDA